MLVDHSLIFEADKAIDLGQTRHTNLSDQLVATFNPAADATGVTFKLQHCDTESGEYTDIAVYGPVDVTAGVPVQFAVPYRVKQYLKATPTTGYTAFLTIGRVLVDAVPQAKSITDAPVSEQSAAA